ncbi:MAG: hypothetical protein J6S76_07150 [Clostridia bacterium]|nr:hypothetical protein [Clostridia bacterium]
MKRRFIAAEEQSAPGAVHALGTGRILAYGQGPEFMQILGAPYSCPSLCEMRLSADESLRADCPIPFSVTTRISGSASYRHTLSVRHRKHAPRTLGTVTDTACRRHHLILRTWELTSPVSFRLTPHPDAAIREITPLIPGRPSCAAYSVTVLQNASVVRDLPVGVPATLAFAVRGDYSTEQRDGALILTLSGTGELYLVCGNTLPQAHASLCLALQNQAETLRADQHKADAAYLAACRENRPPIPAIPQAEAIDEAIEDALLTIRAQQAEFGGVLAGYACHLASVREQYGILRGQLAMGDVTGARAVLDRLLSTEEHGMGGGAHGTGISHEPVLRHENDDATAPSYLTLSALAYFEKTGDRACFLRCLPVCRDALRRALTSYAGGMMPFSGNEPLFSSGALPRASIEHGSLEATALLIRALEGLHSACSQCGCAKDVLPALFSEAHSHAVQSFAKNFARRGSYTVNAPHRTDIRPAPMYRPGICCLCGADGWLMHAYGDIYVCACCAAHVSPEDDRPEDACTAPEHRLPCAVLPLPFFDSASVGTHDLAASVRRMLSAYRKTGHLPSAVNGACASGADFGLLLFAAALTGEEADDLLSSALDARDACGAWAEFYTGCAPNLRKAGAGCRPYEAAVNLCGILRYLSERRSENK